MNIFPKTNGAKQLETEVWSIKHFCIGRFPGMKSPFGLLLFELKISKNRRCRTFTVYLGFFTLCSALHATIWVWKWEEEEEISPCIYIVQSGLHTTWRYRIRLCGSVAVVTLYNAIIFVSKMFCYFCSCNSKRYAGSVWSTLNLHFQVMTLGDIFLKLSCSYTIQLTQVLLLDNDIKIWQ